METYRCRGCRKDFEGRSLANLLRCPLCRGPLLSHATLHQHEQDTWQALTTLRFQSAFTMAASAFIMLVMQGGLSFMEAAEVADFFNVLVLLVAVFSLVAAWLWWRTSQAFWALSGAILLQLAAALFFFVVMGVFQSVDGEGGVIPMRWELAVAVLPIGGALLSWRQYRSYSQVLALERGKGAGSRVEGQGPKR